MLDIVDFMITKLQTKQLKNRASIPGRGEEIFRFPQRPDRFYCPPSIYSKDKVSLSLREKNMPGRKSQ